MRLVFVLEYYYPNIGGVETLFKSLIESLAKEGHQITIITSQVHANSPLKEKQGNIQISRIPFNNRYLFTFLGFFYILPYIKDSQLIHTTSYNAAIPAFFAAKLFRKKVIITFHEVWADLWYRLPFMGKLSKTVHYLFEQFLLKLPFSHFIGVSESTSKSLIQSGIESSKVSTIYNGINYDDFQTNALPKKAKNGKYTYTYFGRMGISKGLDLLMEAIPLIRQKYPDSQFQLIIPKVPVDFLNKISGFIEKNQLENYVILKHQLSFETLKKNIIASDCVVIPSYSEGFCFAAVETIALGTPLISSNQTALKEVVSGQFIKMDNFSKEALVEALDKAQKGKWTKSPIKYFKLSDTIAQYKKLYREILEKT